MNLRKDTDGECIEITVPSYPVGITYKGVYYYRSGSTLQRLTGPALNDPDKYQLGAYIKVGYFETDADLIYQDEVHGSLLEQVDKAIDLIYTKYMRAKIRYEGVQRIERYFVPEEALREALLNAICHKKYQSSIPIQISVYDDKLYVANIGSLPENWTLDNLMKKHASKPYNPDIANVFCLAGFN